MTAIALECDVDFDEADLVDEYGFAFERTETRRARLKRLLDCGHWIDGSEPYRYAVWKLTGDGRSAGVQQRTDCEFCARVDARY